MIKEQEYVSEIIDFIKKLPSDENIYNTLIDQRLDRYIDNLSNDNMLSEVADELKAIVLKVNRRNQYSGDSNIIYSLAYSNEDKCKAVADELLSRQDIDSRRKVLILAAQYYRLRGNPDDTVALARIQKMATYNDSYVNDTIVTAAFHLITQDIQNYQMRKIVQSIIDNPPSHPVSIDALTTEEIVVNSVLEKIDSKLNDYSWIIKVAKNSTSSSVKDFCSRLLEQDKYKNVAVVKGFLSN